MSSVKAQITSSLFKLVLKSIASVPLIFLAVGVPHSDISVTPFHTANTSR